MIFQYLTLKWNMSLVALVKKGRKEGKRKKKKRKKEKGEKEWENKTKL